MSGAVARRSLLAGLLALAGMLLGPPVAGAASNQTSVLQDDAQLIYATPNRMASTLRAASSLGVDEIKVSLVWALVAPDAASHRVPRFDARDPQAYPPGAWARYDMLVRMASALGIGVYFEISPLDPTWAAQGGQGVPQGPALGHSPQPRLLTAFLAAVGRRYSGTYRASAPPGMPGAGALGLGSAPSLDAPVIPRVSIWGIWNEPNERSWLNPWWRRLRGRHRAYVQAALYRGIVDASWRGLEASGHTPGRDTILIGELANVGVLAPVEFLDALYCVDGRGRVLTGAAATAVWCPRAGDRRSFVAAHPALFEASGLAHHPYGFDLSPGRPYPFRSWVTLANIGVLRRAADGALAAYGRPRTGGMPIYLSEWGYKTRPPNPFVRTSLTDQQVWLDEGDYLAWRKPWIRSLAQFLLRDTGPKEHTRRGSPAYWSTFQTGLEFANGAPKPAMLTYRLPIWLPRPHHGRSVEVWGQLRDSGVAAGQGVAIEYLPRGGGWRVVRALLIGDHEGFIDTRLNLPRPGAVRLAWFDSRHGLLLYSRAAGIS